MIHANCLRRICVPVTFPDSGSVPIALGAGRPAVPLRNALLALAAAFFRDAGNEGVIGGGVFRTSPPANIGASCLSVCLLQAIGRELKREDRIWLT